MFEDWDCDTGRYWYCWTKITEYLTKKDWTILDPFLGSGTTAYCAKKLNRHCIGIEIEEKYCEIAVKRLSQTVMQLDTPEVKPVQALVVSESMELECEYGKSPVEDGK